MSVPNVGTVRGLIGAAELKIDGAWRLIAQAATPGRGDRQFQLDRAAAKVVETRRCLKEAEQLVEVLGVEAVHEKGRLSTWNAQCDAVDDCLRRHRGEQLDAIRCICDDTRTIASYCSADHTTVVRS